MYVCACLRVYLGAWQFACIHTSVCMHVRVCDIHNHIYKYLWYNMFTRRIPVYSIPIEMNLFRDAGIYWQNRFFVMKYT